MPHFRFRAIEEKHVATLSESLLTPLQPLMDCPEEDFTFEFIPSTFYFRGQQGNDYPFVEVMWFDRGQETQNRVASEVTVQIRDLIGDQNKDIAVIFNALVPAQYYDNGSHY
ncbi:DUF1904 family protein [Veronia pacifica]|uniref:Pseudouridine synthase n=1 Tax=Veronia pacifica TaxID=1080227 RepID=A0A1C3EEL3_9GAMM|nr:DUF1904 family protein [Veronia pacifica]ODA31659.1 pseudouridine synthase [Veronia pacifica]